MNGSAAPSEGQPARRTVLLIALFSLAILGLTPTAAPLVVRVLPLALAGGACVLSAKRARSLLDVASLVLGITALMAAGILWQISLALAIIAAIPVRRYVTRSSAVLFERGRIPTGLTLFAGLVTPGALVGWVYFLNPDVSDLIRMIPDAPTWLLIMGGIVFALANATLEELVWRGQIQSSLCAEFGITWAIGLQALSFGIAHAHGFPRGAVGIVLAGSWAVVLGGLRHVAGGLLAPVLAHIVADATIASIVIYLAQSE